MPDSQRKGKSRGHSVSVALGEFGTFWNLTFPVCRTGSPFLPGSVSPVEVKLPPSER